MSNDTKSGGIGFFGLLLVVFITLKILGLITWSWWWVLWPIWLPLSITVLVLGFVVIGVAIFGKK